MHKGPASILVIMMLVAIAAPVAAHSPEFPTHNDSLSTATTVNDPTKSWAVYSALSEGSSAQYYRLPMRTGENISVQLISPLVSTDSGFLPSLALMGPGIAENDPLPSFVEVPPNAGVMRIDGVLSRPPEYEPFSPSAFYDLGHISVSAPAEGDYYLVVFDEHTGGNYCLAIGSRETFTVEEWLLIPFSSINIYLWEGQSPLMVLAAPATVFIVGLVAIMWLSKRRLPPADVLLVLAVLAGLLMITSSASVLFQMFWSVSITGPEATQIVTLIFAILPAGVGLWALRIGYRRRTPEGIGWKTRVALLVIAGLGILLWAGYLIGPVLAVLAAMMPSGWLMRRAR